MNLYQVAEEIARRLANMFLKGKDGRRPVYGGSQKFQNDPHWRDYLQFYEYFHGDNGAGLGANHQTGWTGTIARLMHVFATITPEQLLQGGKMAYFDTAMAAAGSARSGCNCFNTRKVTSLLNIICPVSLGPSPYGRSAAGRSLPR